MPAGRGCGGGQGEGAADGEYDEESFFAEKGEVDTSVYVFVAFFVKNFLQSSAH